MDFVWSFSLIIFPVMYSCFFIVKEKTVAPVEFFGKYSFMAKPGLNIKLPWPMMIVRPAMTMQIIQLTERVSCKSKDDAFIKMPIAVHYHALDARLYEAYYSLEDPRKQISQYITNVIRSDAKGLTLEDFYGQKSVIEESVKATLESQMREFGFVIRSVLVDEPELSEELQLAYNDVIASARRKDAAKNDADAKRIIMEGEAQAEGQSLVIKATKYKEQRELLADGAKEAFETLRQAVPGVSDDRLLSYLEGIDAREAMQNAASNPATVIITGNGYAGQSENVQLAETLALLKSVMPKQAINLGE